MTQNGLVGEFLELDMVSTRSIDHTYVVNLRQIVLGYVLVGRHGDGWTGD